MKTEFKILTREEFGIDSVSGLTDGKPVVLVLKPDSKNEYAINIS